MSSTNSLSNAKAFLEHIRGQADPFAFLSALPSPPNSDPFFEEEWLDFKGRPQDEKDTKRIWSKALSGYANITDGLVIWGIDARTMPPRGIDAACGLRLIADPFAFESRLRDWIRDANNPPVMGVEYQSIPGPSGEGFVICLVPESRHKPHRAEFADKHYYFRAGDDFLIAEPGLLRTLFYPQVYPYLWIEVSLNYELNPREIAALYREDQSVFLFNKLVNSTSSMSFDVKLHNTGQATAKDIYVVVQTGDNLNYHWSMDWDSRKNPQGKAAFQARRSLHPGEISELFSASFQSDFHNRPFSQHNDWRIIPHFEKAYLRLLIYAENSEMQETMVEFEPEDLNYETASATKNGYPMGNTSKVEVNP